MKKILVTGAGGKIASLLIPKLATHQDLIVRAFGRDLNKLAFAQSKNIEFMQGAFENVEQVRASVKDIDTIVLITSANPKADEQAHNVLTVALEASLEKILYGSPNWKWNRDKANYFAYNNSDSKIFFKAENISQDPELNYFLGLETNGVFLEQLEELSQKIWEISLSRSGSWYIDPMPPALMLTTLNPTQKWPKEFIHERYLDGSLPEDFFYNDSLAKR